jgi:hypothetical protein
MPLAKEMERYWFQGPREIWQGPQAKVVVAQLESVRQALKAPGAC